MSYNITDSIKLSYKKKSHIIIDFLLWFYGGHVPYGHVTFDKNTCPTLITCVKCKISSHDGKSGSFKNLQSATKHLLKNHSSRDEKDNNSKEVPTFFDIFTVYEKISIWLEKKIPISTISEVVNWGIEVKW